MNSRVYHWEFLHLMLQEEIKSVIRHGKLQSKVSQKSW